jgi:hypothetical protein
MKVPVVFHTTEIGYCVQVGDSPATPEQLNKIAVVLNQLKMVWLTNENTRQPLANNVTANIVE